MTRLRWIAVVCVVVLAVGATGTLVHLLRSKPGPGDTLTQTQPEATTPDTPTESPTPAPTPSATPSKTPTVTAPPSATAKPHRSPTAEPGSTGNLGPAPGGSAFVGYHPGQSSWSGKSNGIEIAVSVSPTRVAAGSPVTFTVRAQGGDQDCCLIQLVYGDGGTAGGSDCALPTTGGTTTERFTHTYNKSGQHRMLVQATSAHCARSGNLYITVDVASGPSSAQGPHLPVVTFSQSTPSQTPGTVTLYGEANDDDGYLTRLVVDFGDGTTKPFPGDPGSCTPTADGWPGPSRATLPGDPNPPEHHYAKPGHYLLTMTAYSYGCDGTQPQAGHGSFTFDVQP